MKYMYCDGCDERIKLNYRGRCFDSAKGYDSIDVELHCSCMVHVMSIPYSSIIDKCSNIPRWRMAEDDTERHMEWDSSIVGGMINSML